MIKHTILQGQNTCLNAKVHQVNSRLADGSQDPVYLCVSWKKKSDRVPFYTQNNTQAMLWIPFSCLCDTGYFSSIASCRHGNWLWFPKISSKLALKSQFRADFRLSVASCRHGNWLCFHDPYFTVLFWWLFRISAYNCFVLVLEKSNFTVPLYV